MPESEERNREKFKYVIYHGYIHILANHEDNEDPDNLHDRKNPKYM